MRRRTFIVAVAGLATCSSTWAQARLPRIVLLTTPRTNEQMEAFVTGLAEHGYVDGKTVIIDYFIAPTVPDIGGMAQRAVDSGPDVFVTMSTPAPLAAKALTTAIPIVFTGLNDPLGVGLVSNLARPFAGGDDGDRMRRHRVSGVALMPVRYQAGEVA